MNPCEYRFVCGRQDCVETMEDCRKILVEKLMAKEEAIKRQRAGFEKELAAVKEAEGGRRIFFLCDRRACDSCGNTECKHTSDIRHAANFHMMLTDFYEKE